MTAVVEISRYEIQPITDGALPPPGPQLSARTRSGVRLGILSVVWSLDKVRPSLISNPHFRIILSDRVIEF